MRCLTTGALFSPVLGSSSRQHIRESTNQHLKISRSTNKISPLLPAEYEAHLDQATLSHITKFYLLLGTIIINQ
jgi:hypothetical protein